MQISSNTAFSIVFLVYVDVFQPKWLLLVDICSYVVVSCIFLSLSLESRFLGHYYLLVRAGEWTFSNSTERFNWALPAMWSFVIYFFSPEGGLFGCYHLC